MKTLRTGLEYFVKLASDLPENVVFSMNSSTQDVIALTSGWPSGTIWASTNDLVLGIFGIKVERAGYLFSEKSSCYYTPEQWEVIRLFTGSIGHLVTRNEWLALAEEVLANLEG